MTEIPMALEINCTTGEEILRPFTAEEIAQREADVAQAESERVAAEAEAIAKATQKAELLTKLGITADEAKLLLA